MRHVPRVWLCSSAPRKLLAFVLAPMNVIDLVAIVPFYLELL